LLCSLFPKSAEVPNENPGAFGGSDGGCLNRSFCCDAGSFSGDGAKLPLLLCLLVSGMVGETNLGVCWVPKRFGFSVSEALGLKTEDESGGSPKKFKGVGFPKVPFEANEVPLGVGSWKGVEARLKGLALGSSLVGSLLVSSFCSGAADCGFSLFCSSSEFSMKRGS